MVRSTSLILLPGLACDAALFRDQLPALAARVRVHVADVHRRADSIEAMAALLLAEHPGRLRLAGVSMGGIVALEAHAQAPGRIEAMALLGTTARADTPEVVALRNAAIEMYEQGRAEEVLRANVGFAFHPSRHGDAALVDDFLRMTLERAGAAELARQNRALVARADRRAMLPSIRCPLLVMCGDGDVPTPPECSREIVAAAPQASYVELPQCGHMLTWERPAEVTAALLDWLAP
jgi:pimeloyl-ACP methyl ester carboxylesterase